MLRYRTLQCLRKFNVNCPLKPFFFKYATEVLTCICFLQNFQLLVILGNRQSKPKDATVEKTDEEPKFLVSLTSAPAKRMKVLVPLIADVIIVEMLTISAKRAEEKMEWMKLLSTKVVDVDKEANLKTTT